MQLTDVSRYFSLLDVASRSFIAVHARTADIALLGHQVATGLGVKVLVWRCYVSPHQ